MKIILLIEETQTSVSSDDYNTWALIYLNAQNKTTYGIRIYGIKQQWRGGKFLGADFTYKEARDIALEFVQTGEVPTIPFKSFN